MSIVSRINAAILRATDGYAHRLLGARKRALFASLPETVVEIGPGTGANLRDYRPAPRLVGLEPNPYMHAALSPAARRRGVDLDLRASGAERTGIADARGDAGGRTLD